MLAIVDINKPKEGRHNYYGVMDLDSRVLRYYTTNEMIKLVQTNKYSICGLNNKKHNNSKYLIEKILEEAEIVRVPEITFLDDPSCYQARHGRYVTYGEKLLSCVKEVVFLKLITIEKIVEGISFWYNGINLVYKKMKDGFNVNCTDKWTNKGGMTNDKFISVLNELAKKYKITSLYRTRLPLCKYLDMTGLYLPDLKYIREFIWLNNSIRYINFGNMDLGKIVDGNRLFHKNENMEIIDMRNCVGDITRDSNFSICLSTKCTDCVLLLPKHAKNLINFCINKPGYYSQFILMGTLSNSISLDYILKNLKMFKSKQILVMTEEKKRNYPICFILE